jgi:hypothetical protein
MESMNNCILRLVTYCGCSQFIQWRGISPPDRFYAPVREESLVMKAGRIGSRTFRLEAAAPDIVGDDEVWMYSEINTEWNN